MCKLLLNFLSLSFSEAACKVTGLITLFYLGRAIHPEGYGVLSFAVSLTTYFSLFVTSGTDIYGIREIAGGRCLRSELINNIVSLRFFLALILFTALIMYSLFAIENFTLRIIIIITGINIISKAILTDWIFAGLEKMYYAAFRQLPGSLMLLLGLVFFVHSPDDIITAALISSLSILLNSILLFKLFFRKENKFNFRFDRTLWQNIIIKSLPVTVSSFMISVYYSTSTVFMGLIRSGFETGIYSAAFRIALAAILPFSIIQSLFFPLLSRMPENAGYSSFHIFRKYYLSLVVSGISISLLLFFFTEEIVSAAFGAVYSQAVYPLKILALNTAVVSINILFGNPLVARGFQKDYALVVASGAVINILLNFLLIRRYSYMGAALSTLLTETAVFAGLIIVFRKSAIRV